jgi:hypothetical protein
VNASYIFYFYVVGTVNFGMKLYNNQRNAQVVNLFINNFYLICFGLFSPSSGAGVQIRRGSSLLGIMSATWW